MTLALLCGLVLAATPAPSGPPTAYSYQTPDGVVHYVGSEDDVPEAYRTSAKRIELTGIPKDSDFNKGWVAATGPDGQPPAGPTPPSDQEADHRFLLALLFCLLPALLIGWLRWRRFGVAILAIAIADLGLCGYFGVQLWSGRARVPVGADPGSAAGPTPKARERKVHKSQPPPSPGVKAAAPSPVPAPPAQPTYDPSAPGTPVRKVIKPSGAEKEPEDPEE
jgi:hypothetical protein